MTDKVLLLSLRDDETNSLTSRIAWLQKEKKLSSLEGRDDVLLLSANALLADRYTSHGIVATISASLVSSGWPHLLLRVDQADSLAAGKFEAEMAATLERFGVRFDLFS